MMTEAEHRKFVQARKQKSTLWRVIHMLGSLKLAMLLLSTIAIACAVATFVESGFSTKIAHAHIYRAPWFSAWLGVLIINLLAVTLTRWPWLPKHMGFVTTHFGIIVLLVGSMIGAKSGFEGNVTLDKGEPKNQLIGRETVVYIQSLSNWSLHPFDPEATRPRPDRPKTFAVPGENVSLVIDQFAPALKKASTIAPSPDGAAPPGVLLRLESKRLARNSEVPLLAAAGSDRHDFFGMAEIRLLSTFPPAADPVQPTGAPWRETHMAIAAAPGSPVFNVEEGERSGIIPVVELREDKSVVLHIIDPGGAKLTYRISEVVGSTFQAHGATVSVVDYWPDFEMRDGKPVSISDEPKNPAALVRLSGQAAASTPTDGSLAMEIAAEGLTPTTVPYRLLRGGRVEKNGVLPVNESVATGWADWTVLLVSTSPNAQIRAEWIETDQNMADPDVAPGIRGRLVDASGQSGESAWIGAGSHVFLSVGQKVLRTGFGQRLIPLDFSITLENFDVPRLPGSDKPANWISTVRFDDPKKSITERATIRMNHPASFPGGLLGQFTGQTHKFSQAQWNPENLNETTLQVLYDPGWLPKWIGSTMICVGIGIMFYLKPKRRRPDEAATASP